MPLKCYCTGSETGASLYHENGETLETTVFTPIRENRFSTADKRVRFVLDMFMGLKNPKKN
jgi:hypothetical protein